MDSIIKKVKCKTIKKVKCKTLLFFDLWYNGQSVKKELVYEKEKYCYYCEC